MPTPQLPRDSSRVVLAMSGGVDSSVAAHLLVEAGHEVIGVFMRHGEASPVACAVGEGAAQAGSGLPQLPVVSTRLDHKQGCCSASDAEDARRVADRLGIAFFALNLQEEFGRIMDYFADEYTRGRTPNPCVMCNNWIKFGKLFDYADSVGAKYVATGHYARLSRSGPPDWTCGSDQFTTDTQSATGPVGPTGPTLLRGLDANKDQSYVLFGIQRRYLERMLLPVGGFEKPEIRARAADLGLNVAAKRDSQEICFVTSGHHADFVRGRSGSGREGEIVTTAGEVVGRHDGIEAFTIGQRKGLKVAFGEPRYVVRIDADTNRVVIGEREELGVRQLVASDLNWLVDPPVGPLRCLAQIRYNADAHPASAEILPDSRLQVTFDEPRHGVAPGQAVVLYNGDQVLGGGWIDSA